MVRWHGPVEELLVHPLVMRPRLAFTSDVLGIRFQDNFETALEFRRVLIYRFGAVPNAAGVRQLARAGFTIQLDIDIDIAARREHRDGAALMSRRHDLEGTRRRHAGTRRLLLSTDPV